MSRAFGALGLGASLLAEPLGAQEIAERWMPEVLRLPADFEVLVDRSLGTSYRIFSFRTGVDAQSLLAKWRRALEEEGYTVGPLGRAGGDKKFDFSGLNIEEAEVTVAPAREWRLAVVEIEAALRL